MRKSPYLNQENRLEDVIAGIQVLGSYEKKTSREISFWITLLGNDEDYWLTIFKEHPEFFRVREKDYSQNSPKIYASLRWRFAYQRIYDPIQKRDLDESELRVLSTEEKKNLTRRPVSSQQVQSLISTAIELHEKAIQQSERKKWWKPYVSGTLVIVGAGIGLFGSYLSNESSEEIWANEKRYLQFDKTVQQRISIYERMVRVLNSTNEADMMFRKIQLIQNLDSMELDYLMMHPSEILSRPLEFRLDENNQEYFSAYSRLNELSSEYAVTMSMSRTLFGNRTNDAIDSLNSTAWWKNDSLSMVRLINSMSSEIYSVPEFEAGED